METVSKLIYIYLQLVRHTCIYTYYFMCLHMIMELVLMIAIMNINIE